MNAYDIPEYRAFRKQSKTEQRATVRAAVKAWREAHPGRTVRVVSHGWYGWVLWEQKGWDSGPIANMVDVIASHMKSRHSVAAEAS